MRKILNLLVTRFRGTSALRRGFVFTCGVILAFVVLAQWTRPTHKQDTGAQAIPEFQQTVDEPIAPQPDANYRVDLDNLRDLPAKSEAQNLAAESRAPMAGGIAGGSPYSTPLIAHSAELAVATKEFAKSRSTLEEILERHRGYAARLRMAGRKTGSVLSATLRVPSSELGATVSDLKSLGDVEQEAQSADEITQQHADLEARLANAQATLRRLKELLEKQTYPDGNVRQLQQQIAYASAEVNRLEAERTASEHRVTFANVQFSMREVLAQPEESLSAQLHAAATTGFGEAGASISSILLFFIGRGPVVLLWMAILFVPARLVWKRLRVEAPQTATAVNV
ncbi:MAG TPA: DUF4349 domain-containing protein [Candidatus Acidoferrum sp.]